MIIMLVNGEPIIIGNRGKGEGVGDSSATSCSTIKAQKDAEGNGGRKGLYIPRIRPLLEGVP
jgi:hypothetical protein